MAVGQCGDPGVNAPSRAIQAWWRARALVTVPAPCLVAGSVRDPPLTLETVQQTSNVQVYITIKYSHVLFISCSFKRNILDLIFKKCQKKFLIMNFFKRKIQTKLSCFVFSIFVFARKTLYVLYLIFQCMADGPLGRYKVVATRLDVKPELPLDREAARTLGREMAVGRASVDRTPGRRVWTTRIVPVSAECCVGCCATCCNPWPWYLH